MRDTHLPDPGVGPLLFVLCALVTAGGHALHVALWPQSLIPLPPLLLYLLGGLLILLSLPIWVASTRSVLACQRRGVLMTAGVYRLCRHPMYGNGLCLTLTGLCLFWRSWALLPVPLICLGIARLLVLREERWLCATHGAAYARYRAVTPCLIPRYGRASIAFIAPMRTGPVVPGVIGMNNIWSGSFWSRPTPVIWPLMPVCGGPRAAATLAPPDRPGAGDRYLYNARRPRSHRRAGRLSPGTRPPLAR